MTLSFEEVLKMLENKGINAEWIHYIGTANDEKPMYQFEQEVIYEE